MLEVSLNSLTPWNWIVNAALVMASLGLFLFLEHPKVRNSEAWKATVTPLASIIGSGFLVVAPLMGFLVGRWSVFAIAGICAVAYAVGSGIRYNIRHLEDEIEKDRSENSSWKLILWMARTARFSLAIAYVVAVVFYLELLGAFLLRLLATENELAQKAVASVILLFIGTFGWFRGLTALEFLEEHAVNTKLAIIAGLLVGLGMYNGSLLAEGSWHLPQIQPDWSWTTARKILGAFLIVQGFETSRYLREEYSQHVRISTMRYAQLISVAIYVLFGALATVLLGEFHEISETGIIDLSSKVAFALPFMLVLGAVLSQFSAAIADTIGAGGLVEEASHHEVSHKMAYVGLVAIGGILLWTCEIFQIIAYSSRAFAFYYFLQCTMAAVHSGNLNTPPRPWRTAAFALLALIMLATAIFGIPAESGAG